MDKFLREDFYYCKTNWLKDDNPTRVFRLKDVYTDTEGMQFFVPMADGVFVTTEKHGDDAGNIVVDCYLEQMRKADYDEIRNYIREVYLKVEGTMKLYNTTPRRREFFKEMRDVFLTKSLFGWALGELKGFERQEIYHENEKVLLKLLRSYYKCRILEK